MIASRSVAAGIVWLLSALATFAQAQTPRTVTILYLDRAKDPYYQAQTAYTGTLRRQVFKPLAAAELAVRDGEAAARAAGLKIVLDHRSLQIGESASGMLTEQMKSGAIAAAILDLPLEETEATAREIANSRVPLFNARHRDDGLRVRACATGLFHTMPSWSMLTDALAQVLLLNNWKSTLMLEGPVAEDRLVAESYALSARKFGLKLVERRAFVAGNDPRKRDQINIRLLTSGPDHDAVVVADIAGDFGRSVAYNTARPRPVVGTQGLVASAWHPYWERHGAPQLNRRFFRLASRPMADEDWATWVAVRSITDAMLLPLPADMALSDRLKSTALKVELYKGIAGSFRPWSRQLRQTLILGTHDTVVALAPVDGALHQKNNLDTLGPDQPEFRCAQP
jgi:ABC transporter substrate binding protein (PQQ-dependent alcohol dehydrogenase system)